MIPNLQSMQWSPWTCDSEAIVAHEPEEGGLPPEAEAVGAVYFLEVFIARDFLEDWVSAECREVSDWEKCERLIQFALCNA